MKATPTVKTSERAGRWLDAQGIPARVGWLFFWLIKILVVGVLLYAAFWFALLLLLGVAGAWILKNSDWNDEDKLEWREGHSGFGLYDKNEWRRDMGDPDDPS